MAETTNDAVSGRPAGLETVLRATLEGRAGGRPGACLRAALAPFGLAVGAVGWLRRAAYRRGILPSFAAGVPVVSVGNLAAGGTGKTPFVLDLARRLRARGRAPAVLTRGYGSAGNPADADESRWFAEALPGLPVLAQPDRVASARRAVAEGADVLLLDDGFQHRRLRRDLDIVLLDAARPFGSGWPLPAGILREFPRALRDADLLVLTRRDEATPEATEGAAARLAARFGRPVLRARHVPTTARNFAGDSFPPAALAGTRTLAVCGIARPDSFAATLRRLGADVAGLLAFPDHHAYAEADVRRIRDLARDRAATVVVTEKDAVKLRALLDPAARADWRTLGAETRLDDDAPLEAALDRLPFRARA